MGKTLMAFSMRTGDSEPVWLCLYKRPDCAPSCQAIAANLRSLQAHIGGYIETVTLDDDIVVICDEEGRLKGLPYNCTIEGVDFYGTVLILGVEGDAFATLHMDDSLDRLCWRMFGCPLDAGESECDPDDDMEVLILCEEGQEICYSYDEEGNIVWYPSLPDDLADDAEIMALDDEEGDDDAEG